MNEETKKTVKPRVPRVLTFDLEIRKLIPGKDGLRKTGFNYCDGWNDKINMGISFGAAYLDWVDEYRIYGEENIGKLINDMEESDIITGYNIIGFDMPLLSETWARVWAAGVRDTKTLDPEKPPQIPQDKVYDPFHDIKKSLGNNYPKGWNLDNVAKSNLPDICKNGDGAMAPILFQQGRIAELATYVIQDVKVEKELFRYCWENGTLKNDVTADVIKLRGMEKLKKEWE